MNTIGSDAPSGCRPATHFGPPDWGTIGGSVRAHHQSGVPILQVPVNYCQVPSAEGDEKRGRPEPLPAFDRSRTGSTQSSTKQAESVAAADNHTESGTGRFDAASAVRGNCGANRRAKPVLPFSGASAFPSWLRLAPCSYGRVNLRPRRLDNW